MALAIEIEKLTKFFKAGPSWVRALNGVDLKIPENEIFVLLGRNGAGKTTLIKTLCTLLLPESGGARIFGRDLVRESSKIRPLINLAMGEERGFYWRLTGKQNLFFFAALHNLSRKTACAKIKELSTVFELDSMDLRYDQYSTGMKHRLALARCFLTEAKIIFMDEPTRSLDPLAKTGLRDLIKRLAKTTGRTFFLTTHDTYEAESLADRMAILDRGKIIALGSLSEIRGRTQKPTASVEQIFCNLVQAGAAHVS